MIRFFLYLIFFNFFSYQSFSSELKEVNLQCKGAFICLEDVCMDSYIRNDDFETKVDIVFDNNLAIVIDFVILPWIGSLPIERITDEEYSWGELTVGKFWGSIKRYSGELFISRAFKKEGDTYTNDIYYNAKCEVIEKIEKLF